MSNLRQVVHWRAPEFLYKKKTLLWYLNVAVFFFVVLVIFFLLKNYFGAAIVALAFWVFLIKSEERPDIVDYKITKQGVSIDDRSIPFTDIDSFSLSTHASTTTILLDLHYSFAMPVTLVVKKSDLDTAVEILRHHLPERNDTSFLRWLAHWLHY